MGQKSSKGPESEIRKKSSRDFRLIVPDETGNMHTVVVPKALLMEHSEVFRQLVESGQLKKRKKLKLQDVTLTGILKVLECVENGTVVFENVKEIAETLQAAEKYKVDGIEGTCIEHLGIILTFSNVCDVYEFSLSKDFPDVVYKCLKIIDKETESTLKSEAFLRLKPYSVVDIVKRDTLSVSTEKLIFDAVLEWGRAELQRQGQPDESIYLKRILQPVLKYIRFANMSPDDLSDPSLGEFLPNSPNRSSDLKPGMTSRMLSQSSQEAATTDRSSVILTSQPRCYLSQYVHNLDVFDSTQPAITNGESFCLTIEVLKGKVFLCGVNLALKKFSNRMNATCLYALLCATNTRTGEQKRVRGTFLDTTLESPLMFTSPLYLKDNDTAEMVVNVKMAGNTAPLCRKNDVEIIVPPNRDIAMKVLASTTASNITKCIFKDIIYFF